jgi:hypothetical protein
LRKFVALFGVLALGSVWAIGPAAAGEASTFTSTPSSGPVGTVISVNGAGCDGSTVDVRLVDANENVVASATLEVQDNQALSWSGTLTVPGDAAIGEGVVNAHCNFSVESGFNYVPNPFTVTEPAPTTTTTTTVPVSVEATTTTTAPVAVEAPPAAPVVAEPVTAG